MHTASFRVLASSSGGNCSVIALGSCAEHGVLLIDCGVSPRRAREHLSACGLGAAPIRGVILTHLDRDHWRPEWTSALPARAPLYVHRAHRSRAEREGAAHHRTMVFDLPFEPIRGLRVESHLADHDNQGVAVLRFTFLPTGRSLGYATDIGRPTPSLITHLERVDVLAIESNYCPLLQAASARPAFLKDRITGGFGHLSNEQSAHAVRRIAPREHVVLLHLSRQCNTPHLALAAHAGQPPVTVSAPDTPTEAIPLSWPGAPAEQRVPRAAMQAMLW